MKAFFSFLLCLLAATTAPAQALRIDSTRFYCNGNAITFSEITDIIQTKDKGFFFTGRAGKPGGGILPPCPGTGANPVMGKLDSLGNVEWIKSFCDSAIWATTACQAPDGGFVTCGTLLSDGMIVSRCDAQGTVLWERYYGINAGAITGRIIATPDSGFLLLGVAKDRDSDILVTYDYPPSAFPTADWVLLKLDSLGRKQWVRTLGTSGDDLSTAVLMCDGNNYYFVGNTTSKDHDCADTAGHPGFAIYTIKLDSAGNVLWSKAHGEGEISDVLFDERDNSILVAGRVNGPTQEFSNLPTYGLYDIYLMKIDTAGNYKWGNTFGTSGNELDGSTLCKAPTGGYFITANAGGNTTPTPTQLITTNSNGQVLAHRKFSNQYGYIARYIFPYKNSFCLFGEAFGPQAPEGVGQNCLANTFFGGSRALAFSKLSVVPLSINEAAVPQHAFTLSPNPTRNSVEVRFEEQHPKGMLNAANAEGKQILRQRIGKDEQSILLNTTAWPPGTYLVCWQPEGKPSQCQKLLVQ